MAPSTPPPPRSVGFAAFTIASTPSVVMSAEMTSIMTTSPDCYFSSMATLSPYRSLPAARRVALVTHAIKSSKEAKAVYVQRMLTRGGFRQSTLMQWPADKLAAEVVRTKAESSNDELELLHLLYVQLEPAIQITFLDAAGVKHENGSMPEDIKAPFADTAAVERGATRVWQHHGDEGMRYLRTLARYAATDWPGIVEQVQRLV